MIQQVIFISYIRNPYRNSSSDDVMNQNLLYGFKQITKKLVLVALVEGEMEQDDIAEFYEDLYDEIIFCKGITKGTGTRWGALASMLLESHKKHYKDIPSELWKKCDSETTIIARIPYIDSALIANEIKKGVKDVNYVQYWGDPITLSLITPEQYSFKRFLHKLVEKRSKRRLTESSMVLNHCSEQKLLLFPVSWTRLSRVMSVIVRTQPTHHQMKRKRIVYV